MRTRGKINIDYASDLAVLRSGRHWFLFVLLVLFLLVLPHFFRWTGNAAWLTFLNITLITVIAVLGLNITTGMAGQVSLGHSGFLMVGGFGTAILSLNYVSFWLALPLSALITAGLGMIVGIPSLRLKGFYLAIATLAFFLVAQFVLRNMEMSGLHLGLQGIPAPYLGGYKIKTDTDWYYLCLAFTLLFAAFSVNLSRSRLGRAFFAVRDNDSTAASLGINVYRTKITAFFAGSLFAGVAGGLLASYLTVVRTDQFTIWDSIWYLGTVFVGGAGSTAGAVLGVVFLRLVSQLLHSLSMAGWVPHLSNSIWIYAASGVFGLVIILFMLFQPYGLIHLWNKVKINYKRWPFGY